MINVIKVNLNHASSKAARLETRREQLRWGFFGLIVALVAVGVGWIFFENVQFNQLIEHKRSQIYDMETQIAQLQREGKNLSKDDILSLQKLESSRVLWAAKLRSLGTLIPHDMALTHLTYKDEYLLIEGISRIYIDEREFDVIEEFISRLEGDAAFAEDFEDIKFASFARMTVLEQDIVSFEIRATLKGADPKKKRRRI